MSARERAPEPPPPGVISDFLTKYRHDSQEWVGLMDYTMSYLKIVFKEKGTPSLVTGRVKEPAKVEKKLRKQHPFWNYSTEEQILNNLVDFVGLRVSSYFPDDQKKVLKLIEEKSVYLASVLFTDDKELYETSTSVADDAGKQIVAYINKRYKEVTAQFSQNAKATSNEYTKKKALKNYQRRFGGYTAEYRWVILRPEQRNAAGPLGLILIEIQIRSVLMDSWIAINRDIEYDALTGVLSTQERRILDSIKGLAQTGELLLEQLHHVHNRRLESDKAKFKTTGDVFEVLSDYFIVEDPMNGLSKDPFSDLLLNVLLCTKIDNPGNLKLHLRDNNVAPNCQDDFANFSMKFPMHASLESYVLPQLLRTLESAQIECLWNHSYMDKVPFVILIERTLNCIAKIGAKDHKHLTFSGSEALPLQCGYEGLTLLFCILVWTYERIVGSNIHKYGGRAILLATYVRFPEGVTVFPIVSLVHNLLSEAEFWSKESSTLEDLEQKRIAGVASRLVRFPAEWERGVNSFVKYSRAVVSKIYEEGRTNEEVAREMERSGAEISESMFHWMAKWCTIDETFRIAHSQPDLSLLPSTQDFWQRISNHTLLNGFGNLVNKDGENFKPWKERTYRKEWVHVRGGDSYELTA